MISRRLLPLLLSLALSASTARACIHAPQGYEGAVNEKTKQALLFHDGQNAHLVVSTQLQSAIKLPSAMAWVIPLPSLPSHYEEADPALFRDLFKLTTPPEPPPDYSQPQAGGAAAPGAAGIIVHDAQTVGSYKVQPVEIVREGDKAASALNNWLSANGFGAVPAENQRFYLKRGAVFLALKISNLDGALAQVKPLHIVYPSQRLSLPLKFSSHSGVFDVLLYTFTPRPPDANALHSFHLHAGGSWKTGDSEAPASLLRLVGAQEGTLARWSGQNYNATSHMVADLSDDPTLLFDGSTAPQKSAALMWLPLLGAVAISFGAVMAFRNRKP